MGKVLSSRFAETRETPLLRFQLILNRNSGNNRLGSSSPLLDLPNDNLLRMDPTGCSLESFITHNRKGLLRSPFDTPRDDDVLLGRGKCFQFRKGNVRFRGERSSYSLPTVRIFLFPP
jgi:hypothetical protein